MSKKSERIDRLKAAHKRVCSYSYELKPIEQGYTEKILNIDLTKKKRFGKKM